MQDVPPVSLSAPIFRHEDGELDKAANEGYAERVAGTWVEHVVVAGPMAAGEFYSSGQRAVVVDLWARHCSPEQLVVACWERPEVERTLGRGARALVMLRADSEDALLAELDELPVGVIAYANPRYSRALLTPVVVDQARRRGVLPSAVKLSKVTLAELAEVREAGGPDLQIMHGSSRDIAGSVAAGADIVLSAPLAALPQPWPAPDLEAVQHVADQVQAVLDAEPDHAARVVRVAELARAALAGQR